MNTCRVESISAAGSDLLVRVSAAGSDLVVRVGGGLGLGGVRGGAELGLGLGLGGAMSVPSVDSYSDSDLVVHVSAIACEFLVSCGWRRGQGELTTVYGAKVSLAPSLDYTEIHCFRSDSSEETGSGGMLAMSATCDTISTARMHSF
ncbi:hypothetical protein PF006_g4855 [Phytophthora fragariae]|uniref:Uncharacterized protein n=1 Tax=Phytophthora fragariae TaxID=53985 RepID=A0A6A3UJN0_9STRA|nr:hypothetical protein PF006_g4855 [Phytophthora fragariae]